MSAVWQRLSRDVYKRQLNNGDRNLTTVSADSAYPCFGANAVFSFSNIITVYSPRPVYAGAAPLIVLNCTCLLYTSTESNFDFPIMYDLNDNIIDNMLMINCLLYTSHLDLHVLYICEQLFEIVGIRRHLLADIGL